VPRRRQPQGSVRYGRAYAAPVPSPDDEEGTRLAPWPAAALEKRIEEIMDRVQEAGDNHVERVAALEEYLTLACAREGATWFDAGAWSEDLADSYLALGRVDDAVRTISDAGRTRGAASQARLRSRRVNGPASCAASHACQADEHQVEHP
jgi:hypothetical protein